MAKRKGQNDAVKRPAHYTRGKIEVIDFIEDQGWLQDFCKANVIKYLCRAGHKDASKTIEDLNKAQWYLNRLIESMEAQ